MTLSRSYNKYRWLPLSILFSVCLALPAFSATSVSQFGITWTFDKNYQTGQFANGDYWVVGPVKITSISPRSTVSGGSTMHGSMVNPVYKGDQGYDSRIKNNPFSATQNIARSFPFTLNAGSSLLSSESYTAKATSNGPQLKTIAILTVVSSAPPAGSFRPPYLGPDKTVRWNKSQLKYDKLRSLPVVPSTPSLAALEKSFERPWIEQKTNWAGRFMHPDLNQPDYGREMAYAIGNGVLALQLNYTNAQKETLAVRMVQYGIDIYGAALNGARWQNDGGHNQGRKLPVVLAGVMLGDSRILAFADGKAKTIFQEDQQTWYVVPSDVGRTLYTGDGRPREKYISSDVGKAEWGEKHYTTPNRDGRNWNSYYRTVSGAPMVGHVLAARLMKVENVWNWPAIFDYYDRYWDVEKGNSGKGANTISAFTASMWKAYRSSTPADFNDDNVATSIWENTKITAQTKPFTLAFDMLASGGNIDGVTGLSNGPADGYSDLAAVVRFNTSGNIDARNGGSYQATTALKYQGGVKYRIVMTVNPETRKYSVKVTPPGASAVTIADNFSFRSEQSSVTSLGHVGFLSTIGSHSVMNIGVTSASTPSEPTNPTNPTTPPPPTSSKPVTLFRINAGGGKVVDSSGLTWSADSGSSTGLKYSTTSAIAGTTSDKLYQTERYSVEDAPDLSYSFTVPNGSYEVKFLFAEVFAKTMGKGKRVFDVEIEDDVAFENLDIFDQAGGGNRALILTAPVTVTDGKLNIRFIRGVQNPKVNGIEITKL